jgi:hypothetical protein
VIAIIIAFVTYSSGQDKKQEQEWIASPVVGDVYRYKTENKQYSTLKVAVVSADSVFVTPNEYETNKMSGISEIDKAENYGDQSYGISMSDLKKMHTENEIYDIDRD